MHTTQHSSTCQVHAHPALPIDQIFTVRRQARDAGCQYVSREQRRSASLPVYGQNEGGAA